MKAAYDKADPRDVKLGSNNVIVPEELSAANLVLLLEKERNKILNQRTRDAKKAKREAMRATTKAVREATTTTEKEGKKGEKPGKSKVITLPLLLTETSIITSSQVPRKQDSSLVQFSMLRL